MQNTVAVRHRRRAGQIIRPDEERGLFYIVHSLDISHHGPQLIEVVALLPAKNHDGVQMIPQRLFLVGVAQVPPGGNGDTHLIAMAQKMASHRRYRVG